MDAVVHSVCVCVIPLHCECEQEIVYTFLSPRVTMSRTCTAVVIPLASTVRRICSHPPARECHTHCQADRAL